MTDTWCILRTSGARTLGLARSLCEAGVEAWTPVQVVRKRATRDKNRREVDAPILPTFVFARSVHLPNLAAVLTLPINPHPPFSIFRFDGRIPLVSDRDIASLHTAETAASEHWQTVHDEEHRQAEHERLRQERKEMARQVHVERVREEANRKALKATAPTYADGVKVVVPSRPAFAGMTGVVQGRKGQASMVDFGGGVLMKIDSWLLSPDDVSGTQAHTSIAA